VVFISAAKKIKSAAILNPPQKKLNPPYFFNAVILYSPQFFGAVFF
jgi:hypothetical protein